MAAPRDWNQAVGDLNDAFVRAINNVPPLEARGAEAAAIGLLRAGRPVMAGGGLGPVDNDEVALAIEIANRLNHYPELRRAYDELQKQYIRKVVECNSLTSRLNPCTVKIG